MARTAPESSNHDDRSARHGRAHAPGVPVRLLTIVGVTAAAVLLGLMLAQPAASATQPTLPQAIRRSLTRLRSDANALARCRTCTVEGGRSFLQAAKHDYRLVRARPARGRRQAA